MVERREYQDERRHSIVIKTPTDVDFITGPSTLSIVPGKNTTTFAWDNQSGTLRNGMASTIHHLHGTARIGELDSDGYVKLTLTTPHRVAVLYHYDLGR